MTQHKLQTNRFEFKYVIDEQRARAIRESIRGFVEPDEHVQDLRNCSYPIHSLYLDAPTLVLYRQTTLGLKNRVREAYVSPGSDQLRVTFDRQIRGATFDWRIGLSQPTTGVAANVHGVVLELKFVDRFPHWMRDMVWAFNLQRRSMPKYVHCVEALGLRTGCWLETQANCTVAGILRVPSASHGTRSLPTTLTTAEGCVANLTESLWQRIGS